MHSETRGTKGVTFRLKTATRVYYVFASVSVVSLFNQPYRVLQLA